MKRFYLLWMLLVSAIGVSAQTLIGSAGEVQESGDVQLSFSIGEPVVETLGTITVLTQGFQQVVQTTTDVPESAMAGIALYPIPCKGQLFLKVEAPGDYHVRITDLTGRMILEQQGPLTQLSSLDVGALNSGLYVMSIRASGSEEFRTVKFQKSK